MNIGDFVIYVDPYGEEHNGLVRHVHADGRVGIIYYDKGGNRTSPSAVPVGKSADHVDYCYAYERSLPSKGHQKKS